MSWRFVYCPDCDTHQTKIGTGEELMFCRECCAEWIEDGKKKKKKRKKK